MAGAGFMTFTDGQVLTAAQVNNYLMEQSVMVFATATARTTALPTPSEGMVTYRTDANVIEYYDGAAWQPILDQDVIQAKGDLIVGTGDDAVARLAVGTNNHVLTADSSTATGLKWAAAAGGKVLQVVSATYSTATTITSTSYTDSGLSATITPTLASSTILVLSSNNVQLYRVAAGTSIAGSVRTIRGSTALEERYIGMIAGSATLETDQTIAFAYIDSPATTSATTYKVQGRINSNETMVFNANAIAQNDSSIVLMEIGA